MSILNIIYNLWVNQRRATIDNVTTCKMIKPQRKPDRSSIEKEIKRVYKSNTMLNAYS